MQVQLEASVAGSPSGSPLISLGSFAEYPALSSQTVTLSGTAFPLSAGTRYWIRLFSTDNARCGWTYALDVTGPGVAHEFFQAPFSPAASNSAAGSAYMMSVDEILSLVPNE